MAGWIPDQAAYEGHDDHLIEVEPALYEHRAERLHYEFVIQAADRSHYCGQTKTPHPLVALEVDVLLFPGTAHQEYGNQSQEYTGPLIYIELFTEEQQGSYQYHYRSGGIYWSDYGERKVLQSEITAYPRAEYNECLQNYHKMCYEHRVCGRYSADSQ